MRQNDDASATPLFVEALDIGANWAIRTVWLQRCTNSRSFPITKRLRSSASNARGESGDRTRRAPARRCRDGPTVSCRSRPGPRRFQARYPALRGGAGGSATTRQHALPSRTECAAWATLRAPRATTARANQLLTDSLRLFATTRPTLCPALLGRVGVHRRRDGLGGARDASGRGERLPEEDWRTRATVRNCGPSADRSRRPRGAR